MYFLYEWVLVCVMWIVVWGWPWPCVKATSFWQRTKTFASLRVNYVPICICSQWQDIWHPEPKGEELWTEQGFRREERSLVPGSLLPPPRAPTSYNSPRKAKRRMGEGKHRILHYSLLPIHSLIQKPHTDHLLCAGGIVSV